MKREKGYLILDGLEKLDRPCKGKNYLYKQWILEDGIEKFFKEENELAAYKELLYSIIIRKLKRKSASYDLAKFGDKFGVITPNFNSENYPIYSIEEILKWYVKDEAKQKEMYNFEDLKMIIPCFLKSLKQEYSQELESDLMLQYLFQIIFGNSDLNPTNIEIIIAEKPIISPFYDFSDYGKISPNDKAGVFYKLNQSRQKKSMPANEEINNFLKTANSENLKLLKEYLEQIKFLNLDTYINEIEENTDHKIPFITQMVLKKEIIDNTLALERIMK